MHVASWKFKKNSVALITTFGSLSKADTIQNSFVQLSDLPAESDESKAMSKDLKKRGFQFVGPTICYAFMQAAGLVNDHLVTCFRYNQIQKNYKKKK